MLLIALLSMKRSRRFLNWSMLLGALALVMFGGGYLALFHTSLPLRAIAAVISKDGRVNLEGVSGTAKSGFHVNRVEIKDSARPTSEIEDLSFRYRSAGWGKEDRVIIEDANVGKATVYVNVHPSIPRLPRATPPEVNTGVVHAKPGEPARFSSGRTGNIKFFEINRLFLNTLVVKDQAHAFELSIPKIEWTGFRIEGGRVSPGAVTVASDPLDVQTFPGETVQVEEESISFQKRIVASIKPGLHKAIREVIDAELDLSLDLTGLAVARLRAFDNTFEAYHSSKHAGYVRCIQFELAKYLSAKPFALPSRIDLDLAYAADRKAREYTIDIRSGSFALGTVEFVIEPQYVVVNERQLDPIVVRAQGTRDEHEFFYTLVVSATDKPLQQSITADPPLATDDALAHVLYGKPTKELSETELVELEQQLPRYARLASYLRTNVETK